MLSKIRKIKRKKEFISHIGEKKQTYFLHGLVSHSWSQGHSWWISTRRTKDILDHCCCCYCYCYCFYKDSSLIKLTIILLFEYGFLLIFFHLPYSIDLKFYLSPNLKAKNGLHVLILTIYRFNSYNISEQRIDPEDIEVLMSIIYLKKELLIWI